MSTPTKSINIINDNKSLFKLSSNNYNTMFKLFPRKVLYSSILFFNKQIFKHFLRYRRKFQNPTQLILKLQGNDIVSLSKCEKYLSSSSLLLGCPENIIYSLENYIINENNYFGKEILKFICACEYETVCFNPNATSFAFYKSKKIYIYGSGLSKQTYLKPILTIENPKSKICNMFKYSNDGKYFAYIVSKQDKSKLVIINVDIENKEEFGKVTNIIYLQHNTITAFCFSYNEIVKYNNYIIVVGLKGLSLIYCINTYQAMEMQVDMEMKYNNKDNSDNSNINSKNDTINKNNNISNKNKISNYNKIKLYNKLGKLMLKINDQKGKIEVNCISSSLKYYSSGDDNKTIFIFKIDIIHDNDNKSDNNKSDIKDSINITNNLNINTITTNNNITNTLNIPKVTYSIVYQFQYKNCINSLFFSQCEEYFCAGIGCISYCYKINENHDMSKDIDSITIDTNHTIDSCKAKDNDSCNSDCFMKEVFSTKPTDVKSSIHSVYFTKNKLLIICTSNEILVYY